MGKATSIAQDRWKHQPEKQTECDGKTEKEDQQAEASAWMMSLNVPTRDPIDDRSQEHSHEHADP